MCNILYEPRIRQSFSSMNGNVDTVFFSLHMLLVGHGILSASSCHNRSLTCCCKIKNSRTILDKSSPVKSRQISQLLARGHIGTHDEVLSPAAGDPLPDHLSRLLLDVDHNRLREESCRQQLAPEGVDLRSPRDSASHGLHGL